MMQGSLALSRGALFVGFEEKTAHVRVFDLDGRAVTGFSFRDSAGGRSAVAGLAVDEDGQIWVADAPADRVRVFSLFGREYGGIGSPAERGEPSTPAVLPGLVRLPVDVEVQGHRDEGWVAIACGGERRHAVQIFTPDLAWRASCASLGNGADSFRGVRRLAALERRLFVVEAQARRIQVFRDLEFHFAFRLRGTNGRVFEPVAVAPLHDGRMVVACREPSALFLVDAAGQVIRVLAEEGAEEGRVLDPGDAVVELGCPDPLARLYVVDRDGLRLQVFTLEGRSLGVIPLDEGARKRAHAEEARSGSRN